MPLCGSFFCGATYGMKSGFAQKQFFKLRKIVFVAHAWTAFNSRKIYMFVKDKLQETKKTTYWQTLGLLDAHRVRRRELNLQPSRLRSSTLTIMLQEPCL